MGFRLLPKGTEEAVFKPVPEGWLYKAYNPWVFGLSLTYLVTEAQKPAIAARIRMSRYATIIAAVVVVWLVMAASAKYPWLLSLTPKALVAWGALLLVVLAVCAVGDWLITRSVVRGLPRTTQKIGMGDMWRSMGRSMSTTALAFFTVFCTFAAVANLYIALAEAQTLAWLGAPFMALLAIFYGTMLIAKLRAKPVAGEG